MKDLTDILHDGGHSLVVANRDIRTFDGRGVSDLFRLLEKDSGFLYGASVADKVVGKAAAALMALAKIKEMYAEVIGEGDVFFVGIETRILVPKTDVVYGTEVAFVEPVVV